MDGFQAIREAYNRITPMPDAEWQDFAARLRVNRFAKGDFLIRDGQIENRVHFLVIGATRNYFLREGKEFTVDFHFAGEFVTAYYSFILRPNNATKRSCKRRRSLSAICPSSIYHLISAFSPKA